MTKWRTDFNNLKEYDSVLLAIPEGKFDTVVAEGYRDEYGNWYLANDSCECCHDPLDSKPSHFMSMPTAPKEVSNEDQ